MKTNKTIEVLKHLKKYRSITSLDAYDLFGATRLSAIIFELRKMYRINTKNETIEDRYGRPCTYAKYTYIGEIANAQLDGDTKRRKDRFNKFAKTV